MPVHKYDSFIAIDGKAQFASQMSMQPIKAFVLLVGDFVNSHVKRF